MKIHRGYRYELNPNNQQRSLLAKHVGCARFAYNWGLEQRIKSFLTKTGKDRFTNYFKQHQELIRLKKTDFSWMYEVSKCAPQEALRDLDKAFSNFYRGRKNGIKIGFPKFKKKGRKDNFRLTGTIRIHKKATKLPRLGLLRLKEEPQIYGRILSATVSRKADRWFISFTVEQEISLPAPIQGPRIAVDLGISSFATLSNGTSFENPRAMSTKLRKMKRLSRQVSRKQKGSHNRRKAVIRFGRLHWRISNIRFDAIHKLTTYLAKNHSQIVVEDLRIESMMKNKLLSRAIADMGFYEFRRQIKYKTKWYGSKLILSPRFFPSSKRCSKCGHIKDTLSLSERVFRCEMCGFELNRDLNSARNLLWVAASWAETKNACLEVGGYRSLVGQCPSMKQELNTN
ncbi:MAG: RNA-guided endonuclease InsQ/TnpB family protein [Promethearchaeota archaeon]